MVDALYNRLTIFLIVFWKRPTSLFNTIQSGTETIVIDCSLKVVTDGDVD